MGTAPTAQKPAREQRTARATEPGPEHRAVTAQEQTRNQRQNADDRRNADDRTTGTIAAARLRLKEWLWLRLDIIASQSHNTSHRRECQKNAML